MGKLGQKLAKILGTPFGVCVALYVGTVVMSDICGYNVGYGLPEKWYEISSLECKLFSSLSQLIGQVVSLVF
jgi:hypothetical protein